MAVSKGILGGLVLLSMILSWHGQAQSIPPLEQQITISFTNEPLESALTGIAERGGFTFSYSPSIIETGQHITKNFIHKTVRQILDEIFDGDVAYKTRGEYVILSRAKKRQAADEPVKVSGYIVDDETGERLHNVTVYDPVTLASALTDSFGYFEMEINNPPPDLTLAINKAAYADTVLTIPRGQRRLLSISMKVNRGIAAMTDSVGHKLRRFWSKTNLFKRQRVNMTNVRDTIHRAMQVSFVPFAGTNHGLSGSVVNDYSLNILGGYAMGVRKAEFGGIFNVVRGEVSGFQAAGVVNYVQEGVRGVQLSGVANLNGGPVGGVVAAGVLNFSGGESKAVQLGGVMNVTFGGQRMPHFAGVLNLTTADSRSQLAGVLNIAGGNVKGAQVAGVMNVAGRSVTGTQVAGVLNLAGGDVSGGQFGVVNIGRNIHGTQTGIFNFADSVSGVPIGLISIVLKGYHKIEISADEVFNTNLAFRTGTRAFYNILSAGMKARTLSDPATFWTFGYGLGTAPALSKRVFLNVDFTANQVVEGNSLRYLNLLNKMYLGVDVQLSPKISLTAGGTLNLYLTDPRHDGYWPLFTRYEPTLFYNKDLHESVNMRMWFGAKAGIRFL